MYFPYREYSLFPYRLGIYSLGAHYVPSQQAYPSINHRLYPQDGVKTDRSITFSKETIVTNAGGTPPNLVSGYTLATGQTITVTFEVTVDGPITVTQLVNSASAAAIGVAPVDDTVTDDVASSIGNRVWNDLNGDGVQDAGEPGIENVTMELYTNGILAASLVTDGNGEYLFTNLLAGTYTVVVDTNTMPAGLATNPTYDRSNI